MKSKKAQITQIIITLSVLLIIGVVVLQVIFSQIADQTTVTGVVNDTFSTTNASCTRITSTAANCIVPSSTVITNSSIDRTGNFTECDSTSDGKVDGIKLNTGANGGASQYSGFDMNATYNQRGCNYITGGLTTTVINNLPVLFAVLLLVIVAAAIVIKT